MFIRSSYLLTTKVDVPHACPAKISSLNVNFETDAKRLLYRASAHFDTDLFVLNHVL